MGDAPPMMGILETTLYAEDLDAALRFYGEVIGLRALSDARPRGVSFRAPAPAGAVVRGVLLVFDPRLTRVPNERVPTHGATGEGHVCFRVEPEALEQWRRRLTDAGVAIEREVEWPSGVRSIYVRDPARNSVEFMGGDDWERHERA